MGAAVPAGSQNLCFFFVFFFKSLPEISCYEKFEGRKKNHNQSESMRFSIHQQLQKASSKKDKKKEAFVIFFSLKVYTNFNGKMSFFIFLWWDFSGYSGISGFRYPRKQ